MSSPSRPASQALITSDTSFLAMSFFRVLSLSFVFSMGLSWNFSGMMGRVLRDHHLSFLSISSGMKSSTIWPTAEAMMRESFS